MTLQAFNLHQWIDEHRELLKPPVGNRRIFRESEFIIMVVGGPNSRTDYHVDPSEEFFYQLEGDIVLKIIQDGQPVDVPIREGDILLLPRNVPHSPRRPANTIGLVVERTRQPDEREGFEWYCEHCGNLLHAEYLHVAEIETLAPIFGRFYSSTERRTCKRCGTLTPVPAA